MPNGSQMYRPKEMNTGGNSFQQRPQNNPGMNNNMPNQGFRYNQNGQNFNPMQQRGNFNPNQNMQNFQSMNNNFQQQMPMQFENIYTMKRPADQKPNFSSQQAQNIPFSSVKMNTNVGEFRPTGAPSSMNVNATTFNPGANFVPQTSA